jgi:hypothetical protein
MEEPAGEPHSGVGRGTDEDLDDAGQRREGGGEGEPGKEAIRFAGVLQRIRGNVESRDEEKRLRGGQALRGVPGGECRDQ